MRIKKYTLALILIIWIGPFLDLLTGYYQRILGVSSPLTPGVIYRGLILIPVFIILTYHSKTQLKFVASYFLFAFLLSSSVHYLLGYDASILRDAQRLLKVFLPILGLGALVFLNDKYPRSRSEQLLWGIGGGYGLVVATSIIGFYLLGFSVTTYRQVRFSSLAVFDGQNAVGLVLVLSLPMLLYYIYTYKSNSLIILLGIETMWLFSAFLLGTRMAIVGVPGIILIFHLFILLNRRYNRNILQAIYRLILLAGVLFIGILVYQFWVQQGVAHIFYKFRLLTEGEFRLLVPDGIEMISNFNLLEHLFGIGDVAFTLTENDLVDIYGKFGLVILIPLLLFYFTFYLGILYAFFRRRSLETFLLLICFTIYISHAALAGHAFASAQVNNLFILICFLAYREMSPYRRSKFSVNAPRREVEVPLPAQ